MTAMTGLTTREINETRMYGCTEADLRESVENSINPRLILAIPAMKSNLPNHAWNSESTEDFLDFTKMSEVTAKENSNF